MIKGYYAALLARFSETSGFLIAKASKNDLTINDAEDVLQSTHELLTLCYKEPSFSRKQQSVKASLREVQKMVEMIETINLVGPHETVKGKDKQHLVENVRNWYSLVSDLIEHDLFFILNEDSIDKLFPDDLINKCGDKDFEDILDGASCIEYGLPTPGSMILFRAAESESRKYYTRVTSRDPPGRWAELINDLRKDPRASKSVVNYMDYIRDKRNEIDHPGKRYSQEDSEAVLQQLSSMLKEMYS